jgi:esterase/lipase
LNDSFLSTEHALQSINSPVFFITGTENNQVFNAQTSQLYEAFTGDKQLAQFNNSTHGSIAYSEADAWEYFVINFLNSGRDLEGI